MPWKLRSKSGCSLCRLRRKKCEEAKPSCQACRRSGVKCSYNFESRSTRRHLPLRVDLSSEHGDKIVDWLKQMPSVQATSPTKPSINLSLKAFQLSICESFVVNVTEQNMNHAISDVERMGSNTVHVFEGRSYQVAGLLCENAWEAYCFHMFAKEHGLPEIAQQSRAEYGRALTALYRYPWNTYNAVAGVEIVTATLLLCILESEVRTDPTAFAVHLMGLLQMVTLLGPHAFAHPRRIIVFELVRGAIASASLALHRICELGSEKWRTIPWLFTDAEGKPYQKRIEQQMLDQLLVTCNEIQQVYHLPQDDTSLREAAQRFMATYDTLRGQLCTLYVRSFEYIRMTGWRMLPLRSKHAKVFPNGIPQFSHPAAMNASIWYLDALMVLNDALGCFCVRMSEHVITYDWMAQRRVIDWLWYDEPDARISLVAFAASVNSGSENDKDDDNIKALWLALAERSAVLNHYAAAQACSNIVAFLVDRKDRPHVLAMNALLPASNILDDSPLRSWTQEMLVSFSTAPTYQNFHYTANLTTGFR